MGVVFGHVIMVTCPNRDYYVYLLESSNGATYVGATVDIDKRLRQHQGEIVGGAKYTTGKVQQGHTWQRVMYLSGFPTWQAALQCEWRWKQLTRKESVKHPLQRRLRALHKLRALPRSTSQAIPFAEYTTPLTMYIEPPYQSLFTLATTGCPTGTIPTEQSP